MGLHKLLKRGGEIQREKKIRTQRQRGRNTERGGIERHINKDGKKTDRGRHTDKMREMQRQIEREIQ